ncbi:MAG: PfkB family carbohydrate kinase [Acidiferrobacteraceae bacterium]
MTATAREAFSVAETVAAILQKCQGCQRVVFVSGNFNVVHPGHLRLFNFAAECGDCFVVGVNEDGNHNVHVPEQLRLKAMQLISVVDYAFILRIPAEQFISVLRPAVVVKGKEYETLPNPEREVLESYGGQLLFSSGEARFSSLDLLQREFFATGFLTTQKPADYPLRHGFSTNDLTVVVKRISELKVVVIGDLIVDEYINCDAVGMSQEDPTIVVTPIRSDRFVGGAGIVAAHAAGLGAHVTYLGVSGDDEVREFAVDRLNQYRVNNWCVVDASRPTTLKQRYRALGKTLLRVSHMRQHNITHEIAMLLLGTIREELADADLLIFSDFNYGCLAQDLVDEITTLCQQRNIMMVADSQSSSQVSDISRFRGMYLLTPTEREARLAVRDFNSGLVVLAESLRQKAQARQVIVTLGVEGLLIHAPGDEGEFLTDRLPAFNQTPKDVSGAGDSFLASTSLAMALGTDIWRSAYLGSVAAACQVSRVGNTPLSISELITELSL